MNCRGGGRLAAAAGAAWFALAATAGPAAAGPKTRLARELAERAVGKFGARAAGEGVETLARRIEGFLVRYGDDAAEAVAKAGPRALQAADEAGPHAARAVRAVARHGDDGVAFVAARPSALGLVAEHGDACADALVRHRGAVEGVVAAAGSPAVGALNAVGPRAGRRLAMLHAGGELAAIGRTPEVLGVVARYGDPAADFVWRHKGALAVAAVLATFLADPEPYLSGAKELAVAGVAPAAAVPGKLADGIAAGTNWTVVWVAALSFAAAAAAAWAHGRGRRAAGGPRSGGSP